MCGYRSTLFEPSHESVPGKQDSPADTNAGDAGDFVSFERVVKCAAADLATIRAGTVRGFLVDPNPAWYGYSIGRWEGDTFVVETAGFNEGSWLDNNGHPHTDALRTVERFRRVNFGHMEVDVTIDDPKAYSRPWKADTMRFTLQPDTELLEHLCENNRDLPVLERYWRGQEQAAPSNNGKL